MTKASVITRMTLVFGSLPKPRYAAVKVTKDGAFSSCCEHDHRSVDAAERCAEKLARTSSTEVQVRLRGGSLGTVWNPVIRSVPGGWVT